MLQDYMMNGIIHGSYTNPWEHYTTIRQQLLANPPALINMNSPEQLQEEATIIYENIEDVVQYIWDEHKLSAEKVWVMINALSEAKLNEYPQLNEDE